MLGPSEGEASAIRGRFAGSIELVAGARIADRYRIEHHLGAGGTSFVVACQDERTGTRVAMKLLRMPDPKECERLLREARILAGLKSEHITRLVDFGTLGTGEPYLVTELVDGEDLAAVLRARGRLSVHEACDVVLQACLGLEEAHAKGIVHRDIKPGNVIVTKGPGGTNVVKLVDFGISRSLSAKAEEGTLTETNDLLGTPHYMAPEQIKNARSVDARADIFSLGALLYRLLTDAYPFDGESAAEVIINIASVPAPSLLSVRPDAPAFLDTIIRKCLAKSADARIQTVTELRRLIEAATTETAPTPHALLSPSAPAVLQPAPTRRRFTPVAVFGAGALCVSGALLFVYRGSQHEQHATAPPVQATAITAAASAGPDAPLPIPTMSAPEPTPAAASSGPSPTPNVGRAPRTQGKTRPAATPPRNASPAPTEPDVDTSSRQ